MTSSTLVDRITAAVDADVSSIEPLSGGCVGEVYLVRLAAGDKVVAKVDDSTEPNLDIEAEMLRYLANQSELPVPEVLCAGPDLLIMEFIDHDGRPGPDVDIEAADALAALHDVGSQSYGFDNDTLIGGLNLPNPKMTNWPEFFVEYRLVDMARRCVDTGMLDKHTLRRIEKLGENIDDFLTDPQPPGLIHGDVWGGNVLVDDGHLVGLIDPAIYFADPEIELAFIGLFNTFGQRFYDRYVEHRPIADGFFEQRRALYNLFPLLVHVRLFGGSYVQSVKSTLADLGF